MARRAEVIYVGDSSSIIRASAEAKAAVDSVGKSADKSSKKLGKVSVSTGGMSRSMKALVGVAGSLAPVFSGATAAAVGTGVAMAGLTASVGTLKVGFDALKATHSGFAKQVKDTQAQFQKMMGQAAEPLLKPFEQAFKQVGQLEPALHSLFSGAAKLVQPLTDGILQVAKVALPQLGNILKASAGLIKPLAGAFSDLIKTLGPIFSQTIKDMQPILAPLIKGIGGALAGLMTGINVTLKTLGPAIKPLAAVLAQVGKAIGLVFTTLAPAMKPSIQVLSSLVRVGGMLLKTLGSVANQLAVSLAPIFKDLAKIVGQLVAAMMPFVKTILTELGSVLTQLAPLLANFITQLVRHLAPILPTIMKAVTDLIKIGLRALITAFDALLPSLTKIITALVKNLAPILPQLVKLFGQLVTIGVRVLSRALVELTPVMVRLINAVLPPLIPVLKSLTPLIAKMAGVIAEVLTGAVKAAVPILNALVDAVGFIVKAVADLDKSGVWSAVFDTISSPFRDAANAVIGFIDLIIKAIDLIPGVNTKQIAKFSAPSGPSTHDSTGSGIGHRATGGMMVHHPMFMVGEEAPQHPEVVIATNPAYRQRNLGLWAQAGKALGVPGFAGGGILGDIGSGISSAASAVGHAVSGAAHVAEGLLSKGAGFILNMLPGVGSLPKWLAGMGSSVLGDVTKWIKDQVSSLFSFGGGGGGGGNAANEALGRRMMLAAGWPASQWPALQALWTQESGWNANAVNASSGAYGIPQSLGHGHPYNLGDARAQIAWGLDYIRGRYGSPAAAEAHERAFNWYRKGGWPGGSFTPDSSPSKWGNLKNDESQISKAFRNLNALMGPSGDYNTMGENLSYFPSLWQVTNNLLGSGASSFIVTQDAQGNPVAPFVNTSALGLTTSEENQELGWYGSQIADIRKAIPIANDIAPVIRDAISKLRQQIAAVKKAVRARVEAIKQRINENLRKIKQLQDTITKARNRSEPYRNPKNHAQRAANAIFKQNIHDQIYGKDGTGGWNAEIKSLEEQNKQLGGTMTSVGAGGQIGAVTKHATNQISAIQKQITNMQTDLSNVTGSGSFSPLTLAGITGLGGSLGPALISQATLQAQLASISPGAINAALASANASYAPSSSSTSLTAPTTTQELANLLAGMPALAPGGGRAAGGPVLPGYIYRVGEKGPEDVAFGQPGHVLTAAQTRAGGGMNFYGPTYFTGSRAAKAAVDRLAYRAAIGVA